MSRLLDRQKAISLRRQGKTYSEIRRELKVAKSTLSDWLRNLPLTDEQVSLLENKREYKRFLAIEKTREVKQKKRDIRLDVVYAEQKNRWTPLSEREIILAGLFLYWGEGSKNLKNSLSINNTDPAVVKFSLYWLINGLKIPQEKIKVFVHLYNDMDVQKELEYWSRQLNMPLSLFAKPYIKESTRRNIEHKGFGHGTCGVRVNNTRLKEIIILGIKAISDQYR